MRPTPLWAEQGTVFVFRRPKTSECGEKMPAVSAARRKIAVFSIQKKHRFSDRLNLSTHSDAVVATGQR